MKGNRGKKWIIREANMEEQREEWSMDIKDRDKYTCVNCNQQGNIYTTLSHHILPLESGGKDTMDNGATLCRSCHMVIHHLLRTKRLLPHIRV